MDRLLEALQIPDSNTSYQGSVFTGMESLMILLRRLSYPNRCCDLVPIFGRTEPELSMAFDMVIRKHLRTVPTIVIAHTFCASPDTRISYRQCLLMQGSFCAV